MSAQNTPIQNTTPIANEGCLSRLVLRELLDHIEGMRLYYAGPSHQPYQRCVCRDCIDAKIAEWRKQNT